MRTKSIHCFRHFFLSIIFLFSYFIYLCWDLILASWQCFGYPWAIYNIIRYLPILFLLNDLVQLAYLHSLNRFHAVSTTILSFYSFILRNTWLYVEFSLCKIREGYHSLYLSINLSINFQAYIFIKQLILIIIFQV